MLLIHESAVAPHLAGVVVVDFDKHGSIALEVHVGVGVGHATVAETESASEINRMQIAEFVGLLLQIELIRKRGLANQLVADSAHRFSRCLDRSFYFCLSFVMTAHRSG